MRKAILVIISLALLWIFAVAMASLVYHEQFGVWWGTPRGQSIDAYEANALSASID